MQDHVTLLPPGAPSSGARGLSSTLPPDLLEQVRGRVRLLTILLLIGFAFDPLLYFLAWGIATLANVPLQTGSFARTGFLAVNAGAVLASAALWWAAGNEKVSASRLLTLGLVYEVVICFVMALLIIWQFYIDRGTLPNLTWVPMVIVLFPLILPVPPRRMVAVAVLAGSMPLLALLLLELTGNVSADPGEYVDLALASTFAVVFAYMGARVVYGLGRQVAAARELGSYRLEEKLGEGGMGEVWRARHRMLARPAAIKVIRPPANGNGRADLSQDLRRRFEREAQVIARLRSPHTVDLFDFGMAENGAFYYVMELLDGLDADRLVRHFGPVPAERAIYLLRQVCHSLSEAESCGLVHRDIKPANIFLCRYGEDFDFVKVLDFGLVKTFDEHGEAGPALTGENVVQGTPAFIAPEQALGQTDLDSRVDIYATGCVAYWLLTGQLVFTADTPMALLLHHVQSAPPPPSARSELPIPAALDHLVLSCLAKHPDERPQSARELSGRLAEIHGSTAWTEARARDWWSKHQPARV